MATIPEIKDGLAQSRNEAEQALSRLSGVLAQLDQATAILQELAPDSGQPAIMSAIGNVGAAKQRFSEGAETVRSAISDIGKYEAFFPS